MQVGVLLNVLCLHSCCCCRKAGACCRTLPHPAAGNIFSVKVAPVSSKEEAEYNQVTLTVDPQGVVVAPPQGNTAILGLERDVSAASRMEEVAVCVFPWDAGLAAHCSARCP